MGRHIYGRYHGGQSDETKNYKHCIVLRSLVAPSARCSLATHRNVPFSFTFNLFEKPYKAVRSQEFWPLQGSGLWTNQIATTYAMHAYRWRELNAKTFGMQIVGRNRKATTFAMYMNGGNQKTTTLAMHMDGGNRKATTFAMQINLTVGVPVKQAIDSPLIQSPGFTGLRATRLKPSTHFGSWPLRDHAITRPEGLVQRRIFFWGNWCTT